MAEDKTIQCSDCGGSFTFTAEEQEFFKSKGFANEPRRCPPCRQVRKSQRQNDDGYSRRQMFPVQCAACGKDTEVPFEPRGDRPVYCNECFRQTRSER